jgi:hypothetical protein
MLFFLKLARNYGSDHVLARQLLSKTQGIIATLQNMANDRNTGSTVLGIKQTGKSNTSCSKVVI